MRVVERFRESKTLRDAAVRLVDCTGGASMVGGSTRGGVTSKSSGTLADCQLLQPATGWGLPREEKSKLISDSSTPVPLIVCSISSSHLLLALVVRL